MTVVIKESIIGLKELRNNIHKYVSQVEKGKSFIVIKRSKPIFKILPVDSDELWEEVIDFTKIKKGGMALKNLLSRL